MKKYRGIFIVVATMIIVATGCARVPILPTKKLPILSNGINPNEQSGVTKNETLGIEHYTGTMVWQMNDRAADSLCNARINAIITVTLNIATDGNVNGDGTLAYNPVQFDPSFVTQECSSCQIKGVDGRFRITGKRVDSEPTVLELHPTLWSGLTEQQTTAQCQSDAENGTQTTHHLAFSLQQAGFFDTWRADTGGLPTNFDFNVALRSASGILTLKKNP